MTPEELAEIHPRLYHVTGVDTWPQIKRHGLLSAKAALALFNPSGSLHSKVLERARPGPVELDHPQLGRMEVNDQLPLSEKALETCLDDGLRPGDWLDRLNERVFFWPSEDQLKRLLSARINKTRRRDVLVFDTLSIAASHGERIDLCPINSGSTIRKPARRGMHTFTPFVGVTYQNWRRQRGRLDRIVEVTVRLSLPNPEKHLLRIDHHAP